MSSPVLVKSHKHTVTEDDAVYDAGYHSNVSRCASIRSRDGSSHQEHDATAESLNYEMHVSKGADMHGSQNVCPSHQESRETYVGKDQLEQAEWKSYDKRIDLAFVWSRLLSTLYGLILVLVGVAFPVTEALKHQWLTTATTASAEENDIWSMDEDGSQLTVISQAFNIYCDGVAVVFLLYVSITLSCQQRKTRKAKVENCKGAESATNVSIGLSDTMAAHDPGCNCGSSDTIRNRNHHKGSTYEVTSIKESHEVLDREGESFYLRLGALLFGTGNFVYVCLQIEFYVLEPQGKCKGQPAVYPMFLHLLFLVMQTFFIFKNIKVDIGHQPGVLRFGFAHVLATNMCIWLRILVDEVMDGVRQGQQDKENVVTVASEATFVSNISEGAVKHEEANLFITPYLFPLVLEYSLIAVAVMAGIYHTLNTTHPTKDDKVKIVEDLGKETSVWGQINQRVIQQEHFFAKSHRGLFLGAILLAAMIVSVIMFFSYYGQGNNTVTLLIYSVTDITLHAVLLLPVILLFYNFRNFRFTFDRQTSIDGFLIVLSMCGAVAYEIFVVLATASSLHTEDTASISLSLACASLSMIQCVMQAALVLAGFHITAGTKAQQKGKPGRGMITFLIVGNVSLWMFKTAQIKQADLHRFTFFYGVVAWPIIMNVNLPMSVFFRFHSSVCLADMWTEAYECQ